MKAFDDQMYGDTQFKNRTKPVYQAYARIINDLFHPESIIDFGCANGYSLEHWQKLGIKIFGVEAARAAFKYMPRAIQPRVMKMDLLYPNDFGQYDLVNFTEVAEHLDKKYQSIWLKNVLASVKNWLVISWSNDASSPEHINPRPNLYVINLLKQAGLFFEPGLTLKLRRRLKGPEFKRWRHWSKYILVFNRQPAAKRCLIRHFEWYSGYRNKNLGYFAAASQDLGYPISWQIGPDWSTLFRRWHRVWLYPFEKHLIAKLLILKLFGNKTIIKLDSQVLPVWRAKLINFLVYRVLAETPAVAKPFGVSQKIRFFSGGLPRKNIQIIKKLNINRKKIILYAGRQTRAKGFDRLVKIIPPGWKLVVATDLKPIEYYRQIRKSSLVVLPTRGEGWPNVFADAWYCRRLFLTTAGANCAEAIIDKTFYCPNSVSGLKQSIKQITKNLDWYYQNYDQLYDPGYFQLTGPFFTALLK